MCELNNVPKRTGDDLVSAGSSTVKGKVFCPGLGKTSRELSCGDRGPAALSPTVPAYRLKVNSTDNIWRDEDFTPVTTEGDEVHVIDNA